jgi:predicted ArsR family transcriptional regulator
MKQFYGEVSVVARLSYLIEAESKKEAIEKLLNANCPISLVDDEGKEICEITDQQWHVVERARQGNVQEPDLIDFYIVEERD